MWLVDQGDRDYDKPATPKRDWDRLDDAIRATWRRNQKLYDEGVLSPSEIAKQSKVNMLEILLDFPNLTYTMLMDQVADLMKNGERL